MNKNLIIGIIVVLLCIIGGVLWFIFSNNNLEDQNQDAAINSDNNISEANNNETNNNNSNTLEKTVIPFCTSSSSGLGESGELLAQKANGGNWLEGHRFRSNPSDSDISSWTDSLNS